MSGQLLERLASRAARPVAPGVRAHARLHLLDWLACVVGARRDPMMAVARAASDDPLRRAALLGSVLEMDDVDRLGRVHPGPVIWPAALFEARHQDASLGQLLDAAVAGYEACIGVARMLDDHHYRHCHPTHTAGRFGAAAAAARLGRADFVQAMAIAGSSAGAFWQVRLAGATSKAFHVADAVLGGLFAADCAAAGMTGPADLLEGPLGLFAALCKAPRPLPEPQGWLLADVSFKPWAACRHAHPAIDAALALPDGALADGPIRVETYGDALAFCDRPAPRDPPEARFSLQHALAVVAVRGRPKPEDFEGAAIADPALAAARTRVVLARDAALDAAYPAHFGACVTAGGASVRLADAWGDPEHPLDEGALVDKFRTLARFGGLGDGAAEAAIHCVFEGAEAQPARTLLALVTDWLGP